MKRIKNFTNKFKIIKLAIIANILFLSLPSKAEISWSVTSYEGTKTLRFGRVNKTSTIAKEVKITIRSTDNTPYQIKQVMVEPLTNEKGQILKDNLLYFYTVRGSNTRGDLRNTFLAPLTSGETILYNSTQGKSDSFKIVYVLDGKKIKTASGNFTGRIIYILESQNKPSQESILTINFNVKSELEINVETSYQKGKVKLSTESEKNLEGYLKFQIKGNKGELKVYQRMEMYPVSKEGIPLKKEILKFFVSSQKFQKEESFYKNPHPLEPKEFLIFFSKEENVEFYVNFILDKEKIKSLKAGVYEGNVIYRVISNEEEKVIPVKLVIEIKKIFNIKIIAPQKLTFSNLKPGNLPQEKVIIIKVESNLDKPYLVTQKLLTSLVNKKGKEIPLKYLSIRQELIEGKGKLKYSNFKPLNKKEETIFVSDDKGTPCSFKIIFRLVPSLEFPAGNYSTSATYSLSER